jgi:diaminopimelate epimerase
MSTKLRFTKMHGAGNDLVVLDGLREPLPAFERHVKRLADRRFGIGFDQLLVLKPSTSADVRMEIFDADGSQVEMCGNGIRCVLKYLRDAGHTRKQELSVETLGGVVTPRWDGELVRVDMGPPILAPAKIPTQLGDPTSAGPLVDAALAVGDQSLRVTCVSMGNPHCVLFVDDVETVPVTTLGPSVEHHAMFPNRVNVEFVQLVGRGRVKQRTWERGTGETLACGSGACAVGVAGVLRGVTDRRVEVELRGGTLLIEWDGPGKSVFMTGPAATVFKGEIELE